MAILRALKGQGAAAGALIAAHEAMQPELDGAQRPGNERPQDTRQDRECAPATHNEQAGRDQTATRLLSVLRTIPIDWSDYNGLMNEGRYGQVFSDAADAVLARVGCGPAYVESGMSWFTAETNVKYLGETLTAEAIAV